MATSMVYLREGTIVPEIPLVWEAVANKAQFALLDILFDWIQGLVLGDLYHNVQLIVGSISWITGGGCMKAAIMRPLTNLKLGLCPSRDLNNHVEHRLLGVGIERDIMESGARLTVFLNVGSVLKSVGLANFPNAEARHVCNDLVC